MVGDDDDEFRKCSRHVPKNKTEDTSSKKYWHDLYEKFDADIRVPQHKRLPVLQEVFDNRLLKKILSILPVDEALSVGNSSEEFSDSEDSLKIPTQKKLVVKHRPKDRRSSIPSVSHDTDYEKTSQLETAEPPQKKYGTTPSMYLNFLSHPENAASRWRPKPPITFTGMSLNEKSEAITLSIAENFVEWLKALGGDETSTLDVPIIMNLFEIGFNAHAADSLCVRVKELLSVTKSIANARHMPEASYTAHLYKQLYRDINSVKKKEDMFAFGTMLPIEMREAPQKDNIATKWIQNKRVPESIASMATVWEGIENLRSTLGYCGWLQEHPEIDPPTYLEKSGLLDQSIDLEKAGSHYSNDSIES